MMVSTQDSASELSPSYEAASTWCLPLIPVMKQANIKHLQQRNTFEPIDFPCQILCKSPCCGINETPLTFTFLDLGRKTSYLTAIGQRHSSFWTFHRMINRYLVFYQHHPRQ